MKRQLRPKTKTTLVRLPLEVDEKLQARAKSEGRPKANLAAHLLTVSLEKKNEN